MGEPHRIVEWLVSVPSLEKKPNYQRVDMPVSLKPSPIRVHQAIVVFVYGAGALLAYSILRRNDVEKDFITLISSGAIFATFGSAISTIGGVWERDLLERVRLDVEILYRDIVHQDSPWRRWPFLPRASRRNLLDGGSHLLTLSNPQVPVNVGTHVIKIDLPTMLEDFFDLPLTKNIYQLARYGSAVSTMLRGPADESIDEKTGLKQGDGYMAFQCLRDVWISIAQFRLARYATHFGVGLTLWGTVITVLLLPKING